MFKFDQSVGRETSYWTWVVKIMIIRVYQTNLVGYLISADQSSCKLYQHICAVHDANLAGQNCLVSSLVFKSLNFQDYKHATKYFSLKERCGLSFKEGDITSGCRGCGGERVM